MAKESIESFLARCHCEVCKGRFIQKVKVVGAVKKGAKTLTECPSCEKRKTKSLLTFVSEFK